MVEMSIDNEKNGYLVFESGEVFSGIIKNGCGKDNTPFQEKSGEVVFNTSHFGYEEMATDPSYYSQILVCSSPMQGNYQADNEFWESEKIWINGFVCLEIQNSERDSEWLDKLNKSQTPVLTGLDTRSIVLKLRGDGDKSKETSSWGAIVLANNESQAIGRGLQLITSNKERDIINAGDDWPSKVSSSSFYEVKGDMVGGPKIAVYDFGCKKNIIRELAKNSSVVGVFPGKSNVSEIKSWNPDGILLSNGPGDPEDVAYGIENVKELLGWKPMFGICLGHQILSLALGGKTSKMSFGHRGGNHPVKDLKTGEVYMTSQNHGYGVDESSLSENIEVTHINLHDNSIEGISCVEKQCSSVQFHPESHPGPRESSVLIENFLLSISEEL